MFHYDYCIIVCFVPPLLQLRSLVRSFVRLAALPRFAFTPAFLVLLKHSECRSNSTRLGSARLAARLRRTERERERESQTDVDGRNASSGLKERMNVS